MLSALSGLVWAVIAYVVGRVWKMPWLFANVATAPLIGIAMGRFSRHFAARHIVTRALLSLATLYAATAAWGAMIGIVVAIDRWNVPNYVHWAPVSEYTLAALWGLTFTGYVFALWPLAYLNHLLIDRSGRMS